MRKKISRLSGVAVNRFRELKTGDFLALLLRSLFRSEKNIVYAFDPSQVASEQIEPVVPITIRKAELGDLEIVEHDLKPIPWEFQVHRFDGVKDFFTAVDNKKIRHISWIYYQDDPNRFIRLGSKDAEIKYCLTLPEHRGKGIYPAVLREVIGYLKEKGFMRVFITVQEDNIPSIRGIEKAGFKCVGRVRLLKIMGVQVSRKYTPMEA